jgi:hypothetical protein
MRTIVLLGKMNILRHVPNIDQLSLVAELQVQLHVPPSLAVKGREVRKLADDVAEEAGRKIEAVNEKYFADTRSADPFTGEAAGYLADAPQEVQNAIWEERCVRVGALESGIVYANHIRQLIVV